MRNFQGNQSDGIWQNLIGPLRCRSGQPLFKLQHLLRRVRKGLREQDFERREWMQGDMSGMMHQGKPGLGYLLRE
jgi:hypothetical protein